MIYKKSVLFRLYLIMGGGLYFFACTSPTATGDYSYDLYQGLEKIEGLGDAAVTIHRGDTVGRDSWFELEIRNIDNDSILVNGLYDGWCAEWNKPIAQKGDVHEIISMYSTFGKSRWKPLNYLLNKKAVWQQEDPDLTFREFQVAIWMVTEGPEFNPGTLTADQLPERLRKGDQPDYDIDKVNRVVAEVKAGASSFEYKTGDVYALLLNTGEMKQDLIIPVGPAGETVSHGFVEGVTPLNIDPKDAERTYPVIQANWNGPGGDKKWLGWNLGAVQKAVSIDDDRPESAGWYFSFNFRQGLFPETGNDEKVEGHIQGPVSGPQDPDLDSDWIENDPCTALLKGSWRLPTAGEWRAAAEGGGAAVLNLHLGGYILGNLSFLTSRGTRGLYWSSMRHQGANQAVYVEITPDSGLIVNEEKPMLMWSGLPIRCIESD